MPAKELGGKRRFQTDEQKNRLIGKQRIGVLNKLFADRYGGCRATYVLPDDDSGLEDLKILVHTYNWTNPLRMSQIIKLRAPWASADKIIEEITTYPRKFTSEYLGVILNYTGKEHRRLRLRTISPVDMSRDDRRDFSRILANGRRLKKRRLKGMRARAEYLEANSLSRDRPWEADGISRRTWERRRARAKQVDASLAEIKIRVDVPDLRQRAGTATPTPNLSLVSLGMGGVPSSPLRSPTQLPASPDQRQDRNFNPILSWLCLRAAYQMQMQRLCDEAAEAT
jgi:hypothetical protein